MDDFQFDQRIDEALTALGRGDEVRAVAIADQLTAERPDHPVARAIRAQALLNSAGHESAEEALAEARRVIELAPRDPFARLLLALTAWRAERLTLAQESFEAAVELSGRQGRFLSDYAWFMAQERGPRLAEQAAREAIASDANSSTAWAALGLAQYRRHRRKEAESSLCQALRLNPNDIYAQSAMVVLLQDRRRDDQAEALAKLLEGIPGTEEFLETVRQQAKERRIARALIDRQVMPDRPPAHAPTRWWIWVIAGTLVVAGLLHFIEPSTAGALWICVLAPIVVLLLLWRWMD